MSQTRTQSLLESAANVLAGYVIAVFSQILIFPLFNVNVSLTENMMIAAYFTAISIARSYTLRRFFNTRLKR